MDRWLRPGSRGAAGGREREGDAADARVGGRRSPVRALRDQGQILLARQSGAAADNSFGSVYRDKASQQDNTPKRATFRTSGMPMKVLNQNEISREADRRSKSPSVIARLMGLDSPAAKPPSEKQKHVAENGLVEVSTTLKLNKYRDATAVRGSSKQNRHDVEIKYPRQDFPQENHLSGDENSHHSRENGSPLGAFDSNKDFIMRLIQGRTPLFSKHSGDPSSSSSAAKPSQITILRPSKGAKLRGNLSTSEIHGKVENVNQKNSAFLPEVPGSGSRVVVNSAKEQLLPEPKLRKLKIVRKHEPCIHPAQIVILKPNLKNLQDNEKVLSRHSYADSLHGIQREHGSFGIGTMFTPVDNPEKIPTESYRGVAIKAEKTAASENVQNYLNGLSYFQQNEPVQSDSDVYYSDGWKTRHPLVPRSSKSSTNRQANKYTPEQWMTSQKSQDAGLLGSGANILGNMLVIPTSETTNRNFLSAQKHRKDVLPGARNEDGDGRDMSSRPMDRATVPMDSCLRKHPRRRSLSIPSSVNEGVTLHNFYVNGERYVHAKKRDSELPLPGASMIGDSQPEKSSFKREVTELPISAVSLPPAELSKTNFSPENKNADLKTSFGMMNNTGTPIKEDARRYDPARENFSVIAEFADSNDHRSESSYAPKEVSPLPRLPNLSRLSSNPRKPHLTIKLEDAENTSPVSVLESTEEKDPISPECFSELNADLNELRLRLDLLKLETPKSRAEGPQLVCDEPSLEDHSVLLQEEDGPPLCTDEEERDFSYLLGILTDSRLGGVAMDMIFNYCYSLQCPVDPKVFEKLEKVFDEPEVWSRAERKLLFDLVNCILSEELAPTIDLQPWVQPCRVAGLVKRRKLAAEDVWKSLVRKRKELETRPAKPILNVSWLDVRDDIDMMGRDIEKMLRNELLDEIVSELIAV